MTRETTLATVHTLYTALETLKQTAHPEDLTPLERLHVENAIKDAYATLITIEKTLDKLAMQLEAQHARIGEALKPSGAPDIQPISISEITDAP